MRTDSAEVSAALLLLACALGWPAAASPGEALSQGGALPGGASSSAEPEDEVEVGASPEEGAWIQRRDGSFSLHLGALLQARYEHSTSTEPPLRSRFLARRVRLRLRGNVLVPWVRFYVQAELAGESPELRDLELDVRPMEEVGLRVGQFIPPFSRNFFVISTARMQWPDLSLAVGSFLVDRDTGAMLLGRLFSRRLEYALAVLNGNGINRKGNDDDEMLYMARLAASPLGEVLSDEVPALLELQPFRFSVGVAAARGEMTRTGLPSELTQSLPFEVLPTTERFDTLNLDAVVHWRAFAFQGELFWRSWRDAGGTSRVARGAYAQASVFVWYPWIELAGRASAIAVRAEQARGFARELAGLVTVYFRGHHLKLSAAYTYGASDAVDSFLPAETALHLLTVQTQVFF